MALSKCMRVPRGLLRTEKEEGKTVHWVLLSEHAVWDKRIHVLSLGDQKEKQAFYRKIVT